MASNYDVKFDNLSENSSWKIAFHLIEPNSTVLDVGCSKGDFGRALMQYKNCIVDGVEPDKEDANIARKVLRRVSDRMAEQALKAEFKNDQYDYVSFMDVIEHICRPAEVLTEVISHLKPNGRVVFSIPNMAHISVRLMLLKGDFDYGETGLLDNTHLHFYTKKEIYRLFQSSGYVIEDLRHSEAIYPDALIDLKLRDIGIVPTNAFLSLLKHESAGIFQYVGSAQVGKDGPVIPKRMKYSPNPQGEISEMYESELEKLRILLKRKNDEIRKLKKNAAQG